MHVPQAINFRKHETVLMLAARARTVHLSVVVPVYNSEECLTELVHEIRDALSPTGWRFEIILVNDFSRDRSWQIIELLCRRHSFIAGVDLRRNFGQDNAIITGIRLARGRFIAIMDDDLQHDPKYLVAMVNKAEAGPDVVYANFRTKRQKLWKNFGSWINGKIAEWVLHKPKGVYLSPYKVIRRDVAEMISYYSGPTPYVDGLLYQTTWRLDSIPCEHRERYAGTSNYGFWRSIGVSARLMFSFSVRPVRLVTWVGLATAALGLSAAVLVVVYKIAFPDYFPPQAVGWASLMVTLLVVSGLQMIFFGVLGEYVGRTHLQINNKPQTSIRAIVRAGTGADTRIVTTPAGREVATVGEHHI